MKIVGMSLMLLACGMVCAEAAAEKKLVMHLGFDEESGLVCQDSTGHAAAGFKAEIVNNGKTTRVDGKVGKALEFDGVRKGAESGAVKVLRFYDPDMSTRGFTIELWMKLADNADWQRGVMFLAACSPGNYGPGFILQYNWRNIQLISGKGPAKDGVKQHWEATAPVADLRGRWVHVAAVCDVPAKTAKIYLDGKLAGEIKDVEYAPPASKYPELSIGSGWYGRSNGFKGALDELKIYNYPLTDAEVMEHAKLDL